MFQIMRIAGRLLAFTVAFTSTIGDCAAQGTFSKFNVGLDAGPLMSGTPQLLVDFHPHPVIGLTATTGYMFRPLRGGIRVDDGVDLFESKGAYFKLGIRLQTRTKDFMKDPLMFVHLLYIRSAYNERADALFYNRTTEEFERRVVTPEGVVNGIATTLGFDVPLRKRFTLRGAMQFGYYKRDDHAGKDFLTVQPGFGSVLFLPEITQQLMLGVVYKFGKTKWGAAEKTK